MSCGILALATPPAAAAETDLRGQIDQVTTALRGPDTQLVVGPPGPGPGYWAGGPSVVADRGQVVLAYRLRRPLGLGRGYANIVAVSADGVAFRTVAAIPVDLFGAASLERPALVRRPDGGWRLYVSCSTPGSKHWWVEALDTLPGQGPHALPGGRRTVVLPGDETSAWKDVVVTPPAARTDSTDAAAALWQMWACRHPLDGGDDQADRMQTWYATSHDGLAWQLHGPALRPTPGSWDARGTRATSVLQVDGTWLVSYDGRASAAENWYERTGFALGSAGRLVATAGPVQRAGRTLRYLTVASLPGGRRWYAECDRPDGANELRTVWVPTPHQTGRPDVT